MFTREAASQIRQEFWTVFGKYMSPVPRAGDMKVNWINYNTKIRDVYFRMAAGAKGATIAITLEHRDPGAQHAGRRMEMAAAR